MSQIKLWGHSDDLVEVEGDINEELPTYGENCYLGFSNGAVVEIKYTGDWKITPHKSPINGSIDVYSAGSKFIDFEQYNDYTDLAVIVSDEKAVWMLWGDNFYK